MSCRRTPENRARDAVEDAREDRARERIAPVRLPAGDEVEALVELREQARDLRGIVLEVAVDRDDDLAAAPGRSRPRARRPCRSCAAVGRRARSARALCSRVSARERSVGRAVVDEDRLPRAAERLERGRAARRRAARRFAPRHAPVRRRRSRRARLLRDVGARMADLLSLEEALERVLERVQTAATRSVVPLAAAAGRVLARRCAGGSSICRPLRALRWTGSRCARGHAGTPARSSRASPPVCPRHAQLEPGEAMAIATGGVVPERCRLPSSPSSTLSKMTTTWRFRAAVVQGDNVRLAVAIVAAGRRRRARVAFASRAPRRSARSRPPDCRGRLRASARASPCLATGTELRRPGEPLGPGEVYEANGAAARRPRSASAGCRRRRASAGRRRRGGAPRVRSSAVSRPMCSSPRAACPSGPHDLVRGIAAPSSASRRSSGASPSSPASRSRSACATPTLVFGLPGNPVSRRSSAPRSSSGLHLLALQGATRPWSRVFGEEPGSRLVRRNKLSATSFVRARSSATEDGVLSSRSSGQESHMIARAATPTRSCSRLAVRASLSPARRCATCRSPERFELVRLRAARLDARAAAHTRCTGVTRRSAGGTPAARRARASASAAPRGRSP